MYASDLMTGELRDTCLTCKIKIRTNYSLLITQPHKVPQCKTWVANLFLRAKFYKNNYNFAKIDPI